MQEDSEPADERGTEPEIGESDTDGEAVAVAQGRLRSNVRWAAAFGAVTIVLLASAAGWLGYRAYQARQVQAERELFVQVARQGAVNLTTIDNAEVDQDVQRILSSATGTFYDDFQKRAPAFVQVVRAAKSKSVGTITEAGLESATDKEAQVLVAVAVRTSTAASADQQPRAWRMRITVQKVNDGAKVSNVGFVP